MAALHSTAHAHIDSVQISVLWPALFAWLEVRITAVGGNKSDDTAFLFVHVMLLYLLASMAIDLVSSPTSPLALPACCMHALTSKQNGDSTEPKSSSWYLNSSYLFSIQPFGCHIWLDLLQGYVSNVPKDTKCVGGSVTAPLSPRNPQNLSQKLQASLA